MNWYKKSQALRGEWWIMNGNAVFADADIGDISHEAYVIQFVQSQYAYHKFDRGEWVDWDGFKMELAKEAFQEEYGNINFEKYKKNFPKEIEKMYLAKLKKLGMTDEEYLIAENKGDARKYGLEHLGWKRINQNNIQTETLTHSDLKNIANGLWEAYEEECEKETFNIEVNSTRTVYYDVPYYLISAGSPSQLQSYRREY